MSSVRRGEENKLDLVHFQFRASIEQLNGLDLLMVCLFRLTLIPFTSDQWIARILGANLLGNFG
jgi:hypothetical protein